MERVTQLFIYPLKSAAPVPVESMEIDELGAKWDRRWMIVNEAGQFVTQRQLPIMATIKPVWREGHWWLCHQGQEDLVLCSEGEKCQVEIWGTQMAALDLGEVSRKWVGDVLRGSYRLVALSRQSERLVPEKYQLPQSHGLSFVDSMPFLAVTTSSLADLNSRLATPVSLDRFRPNIVIETEVPFDEDSWDQLKIGDLQFSGIKNCARCSITTVDQESGNVTGPEPLKSLAKFRRNGTKVEFGRYLLNHSSGVIRKNDPVVITGKIRS